MAQDLACLLDRLDLWDALVVGHSRGGGVSLLASARRQDRVKALVLIEPNLIDRTGDRPGDAARERRSRMAERARRRRDVWPSRQEVYDSYRERPLFATWSEDALWAYLRGGFRDRQDGSVQLACPPEVEAAYYEIEAGTDVWQASAHLQLPVLVIAGDQSDRFGLDTPTTQRFLSTALDARTRLVSGGHFLVQESPERIAHIILEYAAETGVLGRPL